MDGEALVRGIPLLFVVVGGVEWLKRANVSGVALNVSSLVLGLLLGLGYQVSLEVPVDFAGWFGAGVYGLALGLTASGVYDAAAKLLGARPPSA